MNESGPKSMPESTAELVSLVVSEIGENWTSLRRIFESAGYEFRRPVGDRRQAVEAGLLEAGVEMDATGSAVRRVQEEAG